jgi:hypothetical protein
VTAGAARSLPLPADVAAALLDGASAADVEQWVESLADRVDHAGGAQVGIGELALGRERSEALARAVLDAFLAHQVSRRGLPADARVVVDDLQHTAVSAEAARRTLLPHHDGGRASFLTPSADCVPGWGSAWRAMVEKPPPHKVFQGFLILDPGPPGARTGYYPWVGMLAAAHAWQTGRRPELAELQEWHGANVRAVLRRRGNRGPRYVSLLSALGSRGEAYVRQPLHATHEPLLDDVAELAAGGDCACGCELPAERLWCKGLSETLGVSWRELRERCEVTLGGDRHDLVLGHNLAAVHAGFDGGAGRTLLPLCVAVDRPGGDAYEHWLAGLWELAFRTQCR